MAVLTSQPGAHVCIPHRYQLYILVSTGAKWDNLTTTDILACEGNDI